MIKLPLSPGFSQTLDKAVYRESESIILTTTLFILSDAPIEVLDGRPGPVSHPHFRTLPGSHPNQLISAQFTMAHMRIEHSGFVYPEYILLDKMYDLTSPGLYSLFTTRFVNQAATVTSNEVFFRILATRERL